MPQRTNITVKSIVIGCFLLLLSSVSVVAQTGPGGVGNQGGTGGQPKNVFWLDASALTLTNGASVTSWPDQSGNGFVFSQLGTKATPIFRNNGLSGSAPVVRFDGTERYLRLADNNQLDADLSELSIIIVARHAVLDGQPRGLLSKRVSGGSQESYSVFTHNSRRLFFDTRNTNGNRLDLSTQLTANTDYIHTLTFNGSQQQGYLLGVSDGSRNVSGSGPVNNGSADLILGSLNENYSRHYNGDIAEIIMYDKALSAARRLIVENYLSAKYGITLTLAANDVYNEANGFIHQVGGIGQHTGTIHSEGGSGGLVLSVSNPATFIDGEFVMAGHDNTPNATTFSNISGSVQERWNRSWLVDVTGGVDATLSFDLQSEGINGVYPGDASNYVLLYRSGNSGNFTPVSGATATINGSQVSFRITNLTTDGYYTLGSTNSTASPVIGTGAKTWYSYQNGNWDDFNTWTLDGAAIPSFENPGNQIPASEDNVVITAGNEVSVTTDGKIVNSIEVTGGLNVTNSINHNFNTITGNGQVLMQGSPAGTDNFPGGNANDFADAVNGGTVVLYGSGLILNQPHTFNNLQVSLTGSANEVILLSNYILNGDLTVERGTFKINNGSQTTNLTATVRGDVTIDNAGLIRVNNSNARHQFNLYGNLTNNGDIAFTNRTVPNYGSESPNGIVDVNFLSSTKNQSVMCEGPSRFYRIKVDKGVSDTYALLLEADDPANFKLLGYAHEQHPQSAQLSDNRNALGLVRGTVRIGQNINIPVLSDRDNYNVSAAAQLWVDGGSVAKTAGTAIVLYGKARVSAGTFSALVNSGFTLRGNGTVTVDGGELNANQIRTSVVGASSLGGYIQNGGVANVLGDPINGDYYVFNLTYPGNVFTMSGGELNIKRANGKGGIFINSAPENINVTEGIVNLELGSDRDMVVTSRAPFYNVNVRNPNGYNRAVILDRGDDVASTNEDLAAQPLVVLNNLTLEDNARLSTNNQNVTIGRNFTISDGALYNFGTNTTIFNSNKNATLFIGDITGVTNGNYSDPEGQNTYARWEQPFHDFTVDKPGATLTLATGATYTTGSSVFHDGSGRKNINGWRNNLVKVANKFVLEKGTIDLDLFSVRLYGDVTNRGVFGVDFDPLNAQVKLRKESAPTNRTMTTANGAEFGNLRFNSDEATIAITSDLYIKRFEYMHGRFNIGTHNLRIDRLDVDLENEARFDYNGDGDANDAGDRRKFSPADMFITAGNASDGGVSMLINGNGPYRFPFGIGTGATELLANGAKYTPATVTVTNYIDDGYITINPVDKTLLTTDPTGGEILSYYWSVDHSDFSALPTVNYDFVYDQDDVDGASATVENSFVPGSVADANPFTRSYEDDSVPEQETSNVTNNTITFDGPTDSGLTLTSANYTAGQHTRFIGAPRIFYSRMSSVDDPTKNNDGDTWNASNRDIWTFNETGPTPRIATSDLPITSGDIVIIRNGHVIYLNSSKAEAAELVLDATNGSSGLVFEDASTSGSIQDISYTSEFGRVVATTGGATTHTPFIQFYVDQVWTKARIDNNSFVLPQSDYGDFLNFANSDGGLADVIFTYDESGQNGNPAYLPDDITEFPNMRFGLEAPKGSPNTNYTIVLPEADINVRGELSLEDGVVVHINNGSTGDVTANVIQFLEPSQLQFPGNSAAPRTVTVDSLLEFVTNSDNQRFDIFQPNTGTLTHTLQLNGDIAMNRGRFDLYGGDPATHTNVTLRFGGEGSNSFERIAGPLPNLYRLEVAKVHADSSISVNTNFNLNGSTNALPKALKLLKGTLILNDGNIDINLTTGGGNFPIPSAATLDVRDGQVRVSGDNTGILLAGTLRISGPDAKVDMNDNVGNGNNYIEYSVGNPTLEISAGTLTVGAQIRRVTNDGTGALNYAQTGGSVTIGRQAIAAPRPASENSRGMLEVVNGGQFIHTGGELKIVRSNNSPSVATLFLDPGTFNVNGSEIILGDGNSPTNDLYRINSSIPLHQLTINNASSKNPRAEIFVHPLTVNDRLTITSGATLDAGSGSLPLTLNGDFVNDGLYVPNGNLTVLGSSGSQEITGSTATEFYDLDKTSSGTTTLQQPISVTRHLRMLAGTMADNGNTIEVRGNVTHDAVHTSAGGEGIVFAGTAQQQLSRSLAGTSVFGVLSVRNTNGVIIPESNGFNFEVNNRLRLDQGVLNIGSSSLTLRENATIEAVSAFGINNMVRTNSSFADSGLKKVFSPNAATNFVFPVGEDVYSPATVDFTSVGGNIGAGGGSIAVVPNRRFHPVVDNGSEETLPSDPDNVLQYYWAVRTENLSNFTGNIVFNYDQSDVALGTDTNLPPSFYTENEYVSARILTLGGNTSVDKFTPTSVNEANNLITFGFSGQNNAGVYGDYFAGIDLAIPDDIPVFTSTGNSIAYNDPAAWTIDPPSTPFPPDGPRGSSIIVIQNTHTINFNRNRINVYKTEIELGGTITLGTTTQHDLGIVSGQGTISTQTGTLPAGLYKDFFTCTGGELAYGGTGDYSVFKGGISELRRVTFNGSGQRTFPNQASVSICQDMLVNGPTVVNPTGGGISNIAVGDDLYIQVGIFQTGSSTISVGNDLLVEGTYSGQNNHHNTIGGDVRINGGNFQAGNGSTIRIGGDLNYASGTFNSGSSSSRIVMQGNSPQTITGSFTGPADINHLAIQNGTGVTMASGSSITIDNKLTLTNGTLTPAGNKLLLDADATVGPTKEGNATSYVNGTLCKIIVNREEFFFPIGDGARWGHTSVKPATNAAHEWCAQYYDANATTNANISNLDPSISATLPPHSIKTISKNEYWRITSNVTTAPGLNAIVGLRWDTKSAVSPNLADWYNLKVMEWNGSAWDSRGGTGHESNPIPTQDKGFFNATSNISFFEKFVTLGSASEANALPVELISFTAEAKEQTVELVWETASEINNDYFEVRRSVDGINFKKIGEVAGNGNTVDVIRYEFVDQMPVSGISYYQLKQVDFDGAFEHSDKISVEWINEGFVPGFVEVNLYPNPAPQGQAKLKVTGLRPNSVVTFKLLDMFGKPLMQQVIETDQLSQQGYMIQPRARLAAGVYVVSVQQGNEVHQKTMIVR
ncbi:MAG: T9SS type A sorting domain-containing protein [Tunicatimonas sp.]